VTSHFDPIIRAAQLHRTGRSLDLADADAGKLAVVDLAGRPLVLTNRSERRTWEATRVEPAWSPNLRALDATDLFARHELYVASVRVDGRLVISWCGEQQR